MALKHLYNLVYTTIASCWYFTFMAATAIAIGILWDRYVLGVQ